MTNLYEQYLEQSERLIPHFDRSKPEVSESTIEKMKHLIRRLYGDKSKLVKVTKIRCCPDYPGVYLKYHTMEIFDQDNNSQLFKFDSRVACERFYELADDLYDSDEFSSVWLKRNDAGELEEIEKPATKFSTKVWNWNYEWYFQEL